MACCICCRSAVCSPHSAFRHHHPLHHHDMPKKEKMIMKHSLRLHLMKGRSDHWGCPGSDPDIPPPGGPKY